MQGTSPEFYASISWHLYHRKCVVGSVWDELYVPAPAVYACAAPPPLHILGITSTGVTRPRQFFTPQSLVAIWQINHDIPSTSYTWRRFAILETPFYCQTSWRVYFSSLFTWALIPIEEVWFQIRVHILLYVIKTLLRQTPLSGGFFLGFFRFCTDIKTAVVIPLGVFLFSQKSFPLTVCFRTSRQVGEKFSLFVCHVLSAYRSLQAYQQTFITWTETIDKSTPT